MRFSRGNSISVLQQDSCLTCGNPVAAGDHFCDETCRSKLDEGAPTFSLALGEYGFLTVCARCGNVFDSRGLRCCSPGCERELQAHEDGADEANAAFDGGRS